MKKLITINDKAFKVNNPEELAALPEFTLAEAAVQYNAIVEAHNATLEADPSKVAMHPVKKFDSKTKASQRLFMILPEAPKAERKAATTGEKAPSNRGKVKAFIDTPVEIAGAEADAEGKLPTGPRNYFSIEEAAATYGGTRENAAILLHILSNAGREKTPIPFAYDAKAKLYVRQGYELPEELKVYKKPEAAPATPATEEPKGDEQAPEGDKVEGGEQAQQEV